MAEDDDYQPAIKERLGHLSYHIRHYFWLDFQRLNDIYRYRVEEYGRDILNAFNIYPDSIPGWVVGWMPSRGGYFAGNLGPGRMDFRFFAQGNLMAAVTSLADAEQASGIMDLIEQRWDDLIGEMPVKLCFPAVEAQDWRTITGADPKNSAWSYHNGGNWPFLLWLTAAAAVRTGREELAERALETAASRLARDQWAEYFDGRDGRLVGKEARAFQTWTIAGLLGAHEILRHPELVELFSFEEDAAVACSVSVDEA